MSDPVGGNPGSAAPDPNGLLTRLVVLRHAAADYHHDGPDRERPLTQAGEHGALARGRELSQVLESVNRLLVSPAMRTRQTAALALPDGPDPEFLEGIYEATAGELIALLETHAAGCTVLVGHNPGLSDLASLLTGKPLSLAPGDALILRFPDPGPGPLQPASALLEASLTATQATSR